MSYTASSTLREFILVLDDALPLEYSEHVLAEYEHCDHWKPGDIETGRSGEGVRNCHIIDISHPDSIGDRSARKQLSVDATALAATWAAAYQEATVPIGLTGRTGMILARYRTGGYYRSHHDSHREEMRTVSVVAVVESEFTGGELSFFRGDYTVDLQPGQVCLFPATFQYPHSVQPVLSGTRYSLISWLR